MMKWSLRAGYDVAVDTPGTGMPPAIAIAAQVCLGTAHWQLVKRSVLQHQSGCFAFVT
jgi:hypothetical protein